MSVTIASLDWQNDDRELIHRLLVGQYEWLKNLSVLSGYKGKATISNFALSAPLLSSPDCLVDVNDITLSGKQVEVLDYKFSIPVPRCDYNQTWLAEFADGGSVEGKFLEGLRGYLYDRMESEIKGVIMSTVFTEAKNDVNVIKVASSPVTTPSNAFGAIKSFIASLPISFLDEALGFEEVNNYVVYVSPECYANAQLHLADLSGSTSTFVVGGFEIEAVNGLVDGQMTCTFLKNMLAIFDETSDVTAFKVVPKDEINADIVVGGVACVGSYRDPATLIITDNF